MDNPGNRRNWIEELAGKIPGYAGYAARERRRDVDKLHREHLADRLRSGKTPINNLIRELSTEGRLFEVGPLDRLLKKLDRLENRVRFASYGYAGFFDIIKIDEPELQSLYEFDRALTGRVEEIETQIGALPTLAGEAEALKKSAAALEGVLDDFDRTFDQRSRMIERFGPGQPTFGA